MKNKGLLVLGGVVVVLLIVAISVSNTQDQRVEDVVGGKPFLDDFQAKLNEVSALEVRSGSSVSTVYKKDDVWQLKEKNDHRADFSQVKKLLLQLSDLKTIESKTKLADKYAKLGVQEQGVDTNNKLISIKGADQLAMIDLIVGNSGSNGVYVRLLGEKQAWLVGGRIDVPSDANAWLDKNIVDIKASEVQSFTLGDVSILKKEIIAGSKGKPDDKDFTISDLPKDKELKSASALNSLGANLRELKFNDVHLKSDIDLKKAKLSKVEYRLFSGLVIKAKLYELDETDYLMLEANTDAESEKQKVSDFNSHWQKWVYEIPASKADSFRKKLSDILK